MNLGQVKVNPGQDSLPGVQGLLGYGQSCLVAFSSVAETGQLTVPQMYFSSQSHVGECYCLLRVASEVLLKWEQRIGTGSGGECRAKRRWLVRLVCLPKLLTRGWGDGVIA